MKWKLKNEQYSLGNFGVIFIFITSFILNLPFRAWHNIENSVSTESIVCATVESTSFASAGNPP